MRTAETDEIVKKANDLGMSVSNGRKGILTKPMEWDEGRGIYVGFFMDMDDGRLDFFYRMLGHGFKEVEYNAPYHWKVEDAEKGKVRIEYVEGDLYATIKE